MVAAAVLYGSVGRDGRKKKEPPARDMFAMSYLLVALGVARAHHRLSLAVFLRHVSHPPPAGDKLHNLILK